MSRLTIVGLGPGDLDRTPPDVRSLLDDPEVTVVLRTIAHPAAESLRAERAVVACDDLYESHESFEDLYPAIVARVMDHASRGPVVFAVPGSPQVGERSVRMLQEAADRAGIATVTIPAESFLDAVCAVAGIDPLFDGLRVLDGRDLPDILWLDSPTVIGHVDVPIVLSDVRSRLEAILAPDTRIGVASELGTAGESFEWIGLHQLDPMRAGHRVSLVLLEQAAGLRGAVEVVRRLRLECPWDREQTHHTITHNLIEEAYELAEALSNLEPDAPAGEPDFGAYADAEEELGDVLFQVLFHATMGEETGALTLDGIGEVLRSKLVRRHPHVFGDVDVDSAAEVVANWDTIKAREKPRDSRLDGVATGMPPLARAHKLQERAARAGFDWPGVEPVRAKLNEELAELDESHSLEDRLHELGDVLFTVVNLARHLDIDPALALRRTSTRFEGRFRAMEQLADLDGSSLEELDGLWEQAKAAE